MKTMLLFILLLSGCADKGIGINTVYVPQKCHIPEVEKPDIDNTHYISNNDIVAKALLNYTKLREYTEKLIEAQKVCE